MVNTGLEDKLQREIDGAARHNRDVYSAVPGVASAGGDFCWAGAAGTAYADRAESMRAETPIYIASITKMYVAAATMILEERGLLSLDDPLSKHLPAAWLTSLHRYKGRDYSDTNYQLLGTVIEAAAQQALHQILTELIIEPLEMSSTYMHGHGGVTESGAKPPAHIYHDTQPLYLDRAMTSFGPDGGLVSTVEESLRFLGQFVQGKLFASPAALDRMQRWKRIFFRSSMDSA